MQQQLLQYVLLVTVLALVAASRTAAAATYVVAPGGDDSAAGSEAQPWKTPQKASASVQPGDTVRIKAGEYFVGPTWRIGKAGTAESPITYRAFGDGEVRLTCASVLPADKWTHVKGKIYSTPVAQRPLAAFRGDLPLHNPGERADIHAVDDLIPNSFFATKDTLYVWLEDGSDPKASVLRAAPGHVISLYDCHYTVLDGLTVEYGFNGIKDQGKATHHITIRNCTIRTHASQGIQPVAAHCVIEKNLFQKIGTNKYEHGIYGSEPGTVIRGNVFEEMSGAGIHQYNQKAPAGGGCEFSGNIFRKPRKMTTRKPSSGGYYTEIIAWGQGNHRIYNNVFYGEGKRSGISLNSTGNTVANNTFVAGSTAVMFHKGKPGNTVTNNVFLDAARTFIAWPAGTGAQTLDYNLYFSAAGAPRWERDGAAHRTFDAWKQAAGEAHSRWADPLLAGPADARLKAGSPAIDAGAAVKEVAADFDGTPRPQGAAYDLGAYEHKAGAGAK